ncbi:hypothetical protein BUALT_Bualt06G0077400 [Buddleja alternifolia]|uniref:RING-type domain-containing protein n=1 Tax=Buddleja alternifolia TaxID=168488 RepID=A0AAV6XDP9_9LAMI|nr:hypothetical protein BUALT_Bualt06G0077400 [Buddleja alternifolia]
MGQVGFNFQVVEVEVEDGQLIGHRTKHGSWPGLTRPAHTIYNPQFRCIFLYVVGAVAVAAAMNSRKRKMKEVAVEPAAEPTPAAAPPQQFNNLFNLPSQQQLQFAPSPNASQVQKILNNAAGPFRPFGSQFKPLSFTSLLTAPDDELQEMSENLKHVLTGMMENHRHVAEERAAKKLKEKEEEMQRKLNETAYLEQLVELYKGESERLQVRVRCLERTTMSLRASLEEARAEMEEEDAESSFEDPGRVSPVMLDCKVCERQLATVMIWPCRHVCVCKGCEPATRVCPVCRSLKTTSVEICLPID